ncbi:MAG: hypothetical protein R2746_07155 [Acidimicrobiales bacterium]
MTAEQGELANGRTYLFAASDDGDLAQVAVLPADPGSRRCWPPTTASGSSGT